MQAAPMARLQQKTQAAVTTGPAGATGIPCAMVLRLIARSPRCSGLCSHRRLAKLPAKLDPSVGGSGPHAFAVREAVVVGALKARSTPSRPPHPVSDVRDDREPPLLWNQDAGRETWISVKRKWNILARRAGQGKSG